jgi:hypothetical protein
MSVKKLRYGRAVSVLCAVIFHTHTKSALLCSRPYRTSTSHAITYFEEKKKKHMQNDLLYYYFTELFWSVIELLGAGISMETGFTEIQKPCMTDR